MSTRSDAAEMPTLRWFDEEFGEADGATQLGKTRSTLLAVALGAAIIGGLVVVAWSTDASLRLELASALPSPQNRDRDGSRELVDRLLRRVEALKSENKELTEAQQRTAHAVSAIEAEQESPNRVAVYWYSDPAALPFGIESRREPWDVVPLPRRPVNARPALR
jgi:hypothetical protein